MADLGALGKQFLSNKGMASFISDPKAFAVGAGLDPENADDIRNLEMLAFSLSNNIRAAAETVGVEGADIRWGIGAGCCNVKTLLK